MKAPSFFHIPFLLSLFSIALSETPPGTNAILLSKVQTLTLHAHRMTWYRRVSPIEQLRCVGPSNVCKLYEVDTMRCTNQGYDYDQEDIQWSCTAELPEEFKLGSTDVICEGYRSADDKWILKGSCGVEYRLLLTEKGESRYGRQHPESPTTGKFKDHRFAEIWAWIFAMCILVFILYAVCYSDGRRNRPGRRGNNNGGWPWGGGGGDDDLPPPYDYQPGTRSKPSGSASRSEFWTGAAAGGAAGSAAGYAMGRRHGRQQAEGETRAGPSYNYNSRSNDSSEDRPRSSRNFSPTRVSTGFGSTRRR